MGILYGERPRLEEISNLNDIEIYGLSFVGNGNVELEEYNDIQVPLQAIRRRISAEDEPIDSRFIMDYS